MKFLHQHEYKSKIVSPMQSIKPLPSKDSEIALLAPFLDELGMSSEEINQLDKTHEYVSGNKKFKHSLLWSTDLRAHLIVISDAVCNELIGYTFQDIEGQYQPCKLISPYMEDDYAADAALIDELLELIDTKIGDQNAFAVIEAGGLYMQTLREEEGFILEYQAVSKNFHFRVPERLSLGDVKNAFQSFNNGDDKWSSCLEWEHYQI
jgi:hypothetical protein